MNPIIDEIRTYREQHAASCNYDLKRIVEDIRKGEQKLRDEGWRLIACPKHACQQQASSPQQHK